MGHALDRVVPAIPGFQPELIVLPPEYRLMLRNNEANSSTKAGALRLHL